MAICRNERQHSTGQFTEQLQRTTRGLTVENLVARGGQACAWCLEPFVSRPLVHSVSAGSIMMMRTFEMVGGGRIDRRLGGGAVSWSWLMC
jgi:hypothetical protein